MEELEPSIPEARAARYGRGHPQRYWPDRPLVGGVRGAPPGAGRSRRPRSGVGRVGGASGALGRRAERIATTITTAIPAPISRSPTLNTFANGSHAGQREDVGEGPQGGDRPRRSCSSSSPRAAGRARAIGDRGRAGRHGSAVGDDRRQVARRTRRDERHARQREVAQHGGHDQQRRGDVERRAEVADALRDRVENRTTWASRPPTISRRPADPDGGEAGRPAAEERAEGEADDDGVQEEHQAGWLGQRWLQRLDRGGRGARRRRAAGPRRAAGGRSAVGHLLAAASAGRANR